MKSPMVSASRTVTIRGGSSTSTAPVIHPAQSSTTAIASVAAIFSVSGRKEAGSVMRHLPLEFGAKTPEEARQTQQGEPAGHDQERHLQVAAEGEPCERLGAGIAVGEIAKLGEEQA